MILDYKLKGNELIVFAIINGYSQDGESCFSGHLARLQEWTSLSKQSIITILASLQEKGLITKFPVTINGVNRTGYRAVNVVKKVDQPKKGKVKKVDQEGQKTLPTEVKKVDHIIKDSTKEDGRMTEAALPSKDEVKAYANSIGYHTFDVDKFFAWYDSNGWVSKKTGNVIKWKITVCNWKQKDIDAGKDVSAMPTRQQPVQSKFDFEIL